MAECGASSFKSYIKPDISVNSSEGILISFGDETADNNEATEQWNETHEGGPLAQMAGKNCKQTDKLCGYLSKLGARGIVKTHKRRWFVYADSSCKLLYYRTPEDIVPLGEIDIEHASFSMPELEGEKPGKFEISVGGRVYELEAGDRADMLYWLQTLQKKRKEYSTRKTQLSKERFTNTPGAQQLEEGLLSNEISSVTDDQDPLFQIITDASKASTQCQHSPKSGPGNFSFYNWKTELRNALSGLKHQRGSYAVDATSNLTEENLVTEGTSYSTNGSDNSSCLVFNNKTTVTSTNQLSPSYISPSHKPNKEPKKIFGRKVNKRAKSDDFAVLNSTAKDCTKCEQLKLYIQSILEETHSLEEELTAHREIVRLLQRQIDVFQREKQTHNAYQNEPTEQGKIELLQQRDKTIVELEHLLCSTQEEKELAKSHNRELEVELEGAKEEIIMFKESLQAKEKIVISLLSKEDMEPDLVDIGEQRSVTTPLSQKQDKIGQSMDIGTNTTKELEHYKESCNAYKLQNQFLNKEILEINQLRKDDEARERVLYMKCAELEASFYQTQSKYLICLKELTQLRRGSTQSAESQEMVNQLLKDAVENELPFSMAHPSPHSNRSSKEHDQYGFYLMNKEDEADIESRANTYQRRSDQITRKVKDFNKDVSTNVKWENYLVSLGDRELLRTHELKNQIRHGIPHQFRERVWKTCIHWRVNRQRQSVMPDYYDSLVRKEVGRCSVNPAAKQIELDLLRTLPNNKFYEGSDCEGIQKLRRVLLAFSRHNTRIGYCQGLNRLVAIALLFLNEEEAFWCLVAIVEYLMPQEYYSRTLMSAQTDQRVLKELIQEKLPRLYNHMEKYEVDLSLFTFNWFLTVFVDNIPVEMYLRVWDTFLFEGNKVLFRYSLAFFKYREEELLKLNESLAIHKYLRVMGENMTDVNRITQIAFAEINPFPMRIIRTKRQHHLTQVMAELKELNALRAEHATDTLSRHNAWADESFEMLSDGELT